MKQFICLAGLMAGMNLAVSAQVTPSSLEQDTSRAQYLTAKKTAANNQKLQAVSLPFFDDFASYEGLPNVQWWQQNGGVFINNRFGKDPISKNVATFDGLKEDGTEYPISGSGTFDTGPRDTLTSTAILLNNHSPQDSVYLSFYWQAGGNSYDYPANFSGHNLRLEFKDNTGTWNQVWIRQGQEISTPFALKIQPIRDAKYFHADFQFRFLSSGTKGMRSIWNIDYVLLDDNRRMADPYLNTASYQDVALSRPVRSLLKRYTAMPYHQFFANPGQELSDSVYTTATNLNKTTPAAIKKEGMLRNLVSGQSSQYLNQPEIISQGASKFIINGTPNQTVIVNRNAFISIENKMIIDNREPINSSTLRNDTISRITDLHDYYAYDDGTPETGNGLARTGTRFGAYRFVANQPDKVRSIRFYLTSTNEANTLATFRIWNDDNGKPDGLGKHIQNYVVPASPQNGWVDLMLDSAVSVSGTFYVGWGLATSVQRFFNIGFDRNDSGNNHFLYRDQSTAGNWTTYNDYSNGHISGAFMLRPVLERSHIMAAPDQPMAKHAHLYPNPSTGIVNLTASWQQVTILNLFGSQVASFSNQTAGQPLQLGHLPKGMYLVKLQKGSTVILQRLILN